MSRLSRLFVLALAAGYGCGSDAADALTADSPVRVGEPALTLRLVTYNVAGLPQAISPGSPMRNSALISPLLNGYDLALLQEDFAYHAELASAVDHPYASPPPPPDVREGGLGDGLSFFSRHPFVELVREPWRDCFGHSDSGSDCLTSKGFAMARFDLGEGRQLDVYDAHADAGSAPGDLAARASNLRQLADAIATRSAGRALIVAGDLNARYSRVGDTVPELLQAAGLTDAWVTLVRGGAPPRAGEPIPCGVPDPDDPGCDRIDKVLYRDGGGLRLTPIAYSVEGARFVDEHGEQLSDHRPVAVTFTIAR